MSDTPRTDSIRKRFAGKKVSSTECAELYEHASELELDLAEVTKQRNQLADLLEKAKIYVHTCPLQAQIIAALAAKKGGDA